MFDSRSVRLITSPMLAMCVTPVLPSLRERSPDSGHLSKERHCSRHSVALPGCAGCILLRVFCLGATDRKRDSRSSSYDEKFQGRSLPQREGDAGCDEGWGFRDGSRCSRLLWGARRCLAYERPNQGTIRTVKRKGEEAWQIATGIAHHCQPSTRTQYYDGGARARGTSSSPTARF